jgi:hypothetical protein
MTNGVVPVMGTGRTMLWLLDHRGYGASEGCSGDLPGMACHGCWLADGVVYVRAARQTYWAHNAMAARWQDALESCSGDVPGLVCYRSRVTGSMVLRGLLRRETSGAWLITS